MQALNHLEQLSTSSDGKAGLKLRLPTTLTILPTYRCTAACHHCCFGSHPAVKGRIPQERILDYIDQAAELETIRLIVFSGGEAFLLGKDLDRAIAHASHLGLMTRVVSNAFWAFNEAFALKRLEAIREAGLTELNVSTGDFHQQHVPVENVAHAAVAAVKLGMPVAIMVESRHGRQFTAQHLLSDKRIAAILEDPDLQGLLHIIESPWIPMDSRTKIKYEPSMYINRNSLHKQHGCESVLNTLVVTPQETLGACCGLTREQIPELNLGSLRERSIRDLFEEAIQDSLKIWVFVEGPSRITAWAAEKDPTIKWENRFAHICSICRFMYNNPNVRKVIRDHYREKVADISLRFIMLNQLELPLLSGQWS